MVLQTVLLVSHEYVLISRTPHALGCSRKHARANVHERTHRFDLLTGAVWPSNFAHTQLDLCAAIPERALPAIVTTSAAMVATGTFLQVNRGGGGGGGGVA